MDANDGPYGNGVATADDVPVNIHTGKPDIN